MLVLLMFLATLAVTASFAMVREVSFEELTHLSETTMEVVVVNSYAQWNAEHTAIFTHYVVEPLRQVGGRSRGASFEILFAGGRATDGKQMIVSDVPTLEVGGQYILFLHPSEARNASATVGMWQGALRVVRDPQSQKSVVVDALGRLIEKDAKGQLHRGRQVDVDAQGFMRAAAVEAEPGMNADPILTDPQGRVIELPQGVSSMSRPREGERDTVDADTLLSIIHSFRSKNAKVSE
jgi:hypothetical protein